MKNLLILCGGQSPEHVISIRSTKNVLGAIDRTKYQVMIIGISELGEWRLLKEDELANTVTSQEGSPVTIHPGYDHCFFCDSQPLSRPDVVFPVLHGPNGEDGAIQGMLRLLGLPFVGSGILGSAACMDKDVTKRLLRDSGIQVADWILIHKGEKVPDYNVIAKQLGKVVFVKPANMGSSVGVHRVSNETEWVNGIKDALIYDQKVLVERNVTGRELECGVLGNDSPVTTGVGEVRSGNFYSYTEKYDGDSQAEIVIPADIDSKFLSILKETALKAYRTLNCNGMSRVDMFLTPDGKVYVNEINTIPGFTSISMYPKLWEKEGISYSDLIDRLIELAIELK
ncbi:MAG: D-alanine--D-alanine ligase family protein [Bacteroidota bacterium]